MGWFWDDSLRWRACPPTRLTLSVFSRSGFCHSVRPRQQRSEVPHPTPTPGAQGAFGPPGWKGVCRPWVQDLEKVFDLEDAEMTPNTKFRVSGGRCTLSLFQAPLRFGRKTRPLTWSKGGRVRPLCGLVHLELNATQSAPNIPSSPNMH